MIRSELIHRLAALFPQFTPKDTELAVKAILEALSNTLVKGTALKYVVSEASGSTTGRPVLGATQKPVRPRGFQRKLFPTFGRGKNCVPRSTRADNGHDET
jgi:integration host factor subunit beta